MTVVMPGPVTFGRNMQYIPQQRQLQRGGQRESIQRLAATVYCLATFSVFVVCNPTTTPPSTTTTLPPTLSRRPRAQPWNIITLANGNGRVPISLVETSLHYDIRDCMTHLVTFALEGLGPQEGFSVC